MQQPLPLAPVAQVPPQPPQGRPRPLFTNTDYDPTHKWDTLKMAALSLDTPAIGVAGLGTGRAATAALSALRSPRVFKQEEVDGRPVILFLPIRTDQAGDAWDTQLATVLSSIPARFYTPTLKIVAGRSDEVIRVLSTIAGRISLCHALHLDIVAGVTPELAGAMYTLTGTCTWLRGIVRLDCSGAARTISNYQLWATFLQTFRALCVAVDYDKKPAGLTPDRASMLKQALHTHSRLMYYVSQRDYRDDASRRLLAEVVAASPTLVGVRVGYTTHSMVAFHATDLCAEIAKHTPLPARLADVLNVGKRANLERIPGNLVAHMRANRGTNVTSRAVVDRLFDVRTGGSTRAIKCVDRARVVMDVAAAAKFYMTPYALEVLVRMFDQYDPVRTERATQWLPANAFARVRGSNVLGAGLRDILGRPRDAEAADPLDNVTDDVLRAPSTTHAIPPLPATGTPATVTLTASDGASIDVPMARAWRMKTVRDFVGGCPCDPMPLLIPEADEDAVRAVVALEGLMHAHPDDGMRRLTAVAAYLGAPSATEGTRHLVLAEAWRACQPSASKRVCAKPET